MRRTTRLLLTALCFAGAPPLAAQLPVALATGPDKPEPEQQMSPAVPAAALKPAYAIRLVSDWPQLSEAGTGCVNGGEEILSGTLIRTGEGNYSGQLERRATILFCGVHGVAQQACALTLTSRGAVEASGVVHPTQAGWSEPEVQLRWATAADTGEVTITGDCAPAFNESLRRLYLGVTHALEFPLPLAGEGHRTLRLDEYGWIVDVQ